MNTDIQAAFHQAVRDNDVETARRMIAAGADVNAAYDEYGNRSFLDACYRGDLNCVKMLVDAGADVNLPDSCGTGPLVRSIVSIHDTDEVVKFLIACGANVNASEGESWAPLEAAVRENAADIVRLLLDAGAEPNVREVALGLPLELAMKSKKFNLVGMLLNAGACFANQEDYYTDAVLRNIGDKLIVNSMKSNGIPLRTDDATMGLLASFRCSYLLRKSMEAKANMNEASYHEIIHPVVEIGDLGYNAVASWLAAGGRLARQDEYYRIDVLRGIYNYWLWQSMKENAVPFRTDDATIVQLAKGSYFYLLRATLEAGGNPDACDEDGRSAFEWAWEGRLSTPHCVACLIKHGAGYCPSLFVRAVYERKREIITAMLERGVDVNEQDGRGNTALHYATRSNSTAIIRELIAGGADVEARNHDNLTPLMLAIEKRRCEAASVLLEAGADRNASGGQNDVSIDEMCFLRLCKIEGDSLRKVDWRTGSCGWPQHAYKQLKNLNMLLMECCWEADVNKAKELVQAGADPDYQDGRGYTPLMLACAGGSLELVRYLLEQGADLHACEFEKGWNALSFAGLNNRTEICEFLQERIRDI